MLLTVDDYAKIKPVTADYTLSYGNHPSQFAELYLPAKLPVKSENLPVIILLHGGCWRAKFGLVQLGQLACAITELGFAVWNLEFRRLGNGGGWPSTFQDVAAGSGLLASIAKQYQLDLSSVFTIGHSAGGHLALWLAGRHCLAKNSICYSKKPLKINGVLSLAGIPDLELGVQQQICRGACEELMGGLPGEITEAYRQASPHHLLPLGVPQWHLLGTRDDVIPVDYLSDYIARAKQVDTVFFDLIEDVGHFELVVPNSKAWPYLESAIKQLSSD